MREGDALPVVQKVVTQERIHRYAEVSGDFNPIHVDEGFARGSQFGSTIAHGMMVAAFISEMMTVAFGDDWANGGRLKIRFRAPVYPGDSVTAFGQVRAVRQREAVTEVACDVGVRRQNGEAAITGDATVSVRPKNGSSP